MRIESWLMVALLVSLAVPVCAKDKNKSSLPDYVLAARTVVVVIEPDAGEPVDNPTANATARDNVEKALMEWGRLHPMLEGEQADLVIAVRKGTGKAMQPTIKGGPIDQRGGVAQPTDGDIRVGGQIGQPPPVSQPGPGPQGGPHISNEIGAGDDSFLVYRGGVEYPLDSPAIWRYTGKDCLRAPNVSAVEEFRKAIAQAEQQRQASKKP